MGIHAHTLELIGGEVCLAFTDTVDWRKSDHPQELLASYSDLVSWSQDVGILTGEDAERLLQQAKCRQPEAGAVFERAIALRETIYRIFTAIADGQPLAPDDLEMLNDALSEASARLRVVPTMEGFAWDWANRDEALDQMLWQIVRLAAGLLTSEKLDRVKQCPGCGWLFLDQSRNRSRRWCTMKVCGNRAKSHRHYERKKRQRVTDQPVSAAGITTISNGQE
ncbi:MAG: ABATE domain-containing protein [Chloroflexota bacterium]|nr:ABATE domain-containing protein [Chloroflexota bacterium]